MTGRQSLRHRVHTRLLPCILWSLVSLLSWSHAQAQIASTPELLATMTANAVRIEAGGRTGFGFIVGLDDGQVLIATAWHTLRDLPTAEVEACFALAGETCVAGSVVYVADAIGTSPALDLAIVAAPYPDALAWRPDVFAERPAADEPVWFIGRSRDWYVPETPGRVTGADAAQQTLSYAELEVAEGVSGAPIITADGIVAMHTESIGTGNDARGVEIAAIREHIVDRMRAHWALVPRAACDDQEAHRRVLAGRSITIHFNGAQPRAGLDAIARLNCLGARALPQPDWSADARASGGTIVYPSGEVRAARAIQAALAPLGALDTRLGGALEVWVR